VNLLPTDDQRLLAAGVRDFLASECTPDHVRAIWEAGRHDTQRWKALAGLGVTGLTVPEDHGGLGLDDRDLVQVLIETGRAALPEPIVETAVAAGLLAAIGGDLAGTWLPRLAAGDAVVVPVLPHDPYPAHASSADLFLVAADAATVVAAEPDAVAITPQPNLDGARPTAHVRLRDPAAAPALAGPAATAAIRTAEARGAMGAAAQLVGVGHAAIDLAVAYAKQREQFGVAIGTFQAVKHHLATALVDVAFARPLVERAAHALATGDPDAAPHAAMAKAFASEAAEAAVEHALQVHGAIGYTWECDLHLWLKRAYSLSAAFGDVETQWQAVEAHLLA
jgi:alkylation response protein AidB-like acyl-CoA dehydrogenase